MVFQTDQDNRLSDEMTKFQSPIEGALFLTGLTNATVYVDPAAADWIRSKAGDSFGLCILSPDSPLPLGLQRFDTLLAKTLWGWSGFAPGARFSLDANQKDLDAIDFDSMKAEWARLRNQGLGASFLFEELRPALFLDRDGVLIEYGSYLSDPDQVKLNPQVVDLIRDANTREIPVVIATNQSGLGRGLFTWKDCQRVHGRIQRDLASEGVFVEGFQIASFIDGAKTTLGTVGPGTRKPEAGMFYEAAIRWGLDLANSTLVGDRLSDLGAALTAELKRFVFIENPKYDELSQIQASAAGKIELITCKNRDSIELNLE